MRRMSARTLTVAAIAALAAACGRPANAPADLEQVRVDQGDTQLELTQRFDDEGELVETVVMHREGGDEQVVRVLGPLMTADGATDGGARLRRFFGSLDPSLLARLHQAGLRYDLAVLTADAMLALDAAGQRRAAHELSPEHDAETELCLLIGACASEDTAPQT